MPSYLLQLSYSAEAMAAMIKNPSDRGEALRKLAKQLGAKVVGSWLAFGDYDFVAVIEGPDNVSAAACSMVASASGAFTAMKTTPLLSMEEGMAAMKKAGTLGYTPPTATK